MSIGPYLPSGPRSVERSRVGQRQSLRETKYRSVLVPSVAISLFEAIIPPYMVDFDGDSDVFGAYASPYHWPVECDDGVCGPPAATGCCGSMPI